MIEVEGAGGVGGVPGFYVEELKIDAVGGSLVLEQVPVVVLNVPNPLSPANVIDAIIGMHVFAGRNLVIDAAPAALIPGSFPSLYISDPVTESHQWAAPCRHRRLGHGRKLVGSRGAKRFVDRRGC